MNKTIGNLGLASILASTVLSPQSDDSLLNASSINIVNTTKTISPNKFSFDNGDIGVFTSGNKEGTYVESNLFYGLPEKVKGYTFLDAYVEGGYYGETTLTRELHSHLENLSARTQIIHGDKPLSEVGFGLGLDIPTKFLTEGSLGNLIKGAYINFDFMPIWINSSGNKIDSKMLAGYSIGLDFPHGISMFSFGEWHIGKSGVPFEYGEVNLAKSFNLLGKEFSIGYNGQLSEGKNRKAVPEVTHRAIVRIKF
ncbi:hypothetical protein COU54_01590 [Candidatus Pacearchaeota archaeon CG10_big_fil_rev_8_21_14_0_10_31_24]|nr:MAG: hypothetical protein COU54_01590 [Candidatus Pacearchaeota archaeon CG10_big_fil_rev_8_21_14_0_10_31_24]